MASDGKVLRFNSVAYSGQEERLLNTVSLMPGLASAPFSARGGRRVNGSGLALTVSSTGNGTVTVSAGPGLIYDSGYPTQGGWPFEIPTAIGPITLAARPGAGVTRVDLVVARIYDVDVLTSSVREVKIEVVPGTPTAAALPPLSLLLGTLSVPNTGTITFTPTTAVTVAAGGVLPVATTSERDALAAYPGLTVFNAQTGTLETYNGTSWVGPRNASAAGFSTFPTINIANNVYPKNIAFPVGRFSTPPAVTVTLTTPVSAGTTIIVTAPLSSITAAGFTANISRSTGTGTFDFAWTAIAVD